MNDKEQSQEESELRINYDSKGNPIGMKLSDGTIYGELELQPSLGLNPQAKQSARKHTKPTLSWAVDQAHLNELLAKYWEREAEEARELLSYALDNFDLRDQDDKDWETRARGLITNKEAGE